MIIVVQTLCTGLACYLVWEWIRRAKWTPRVRLLISLGLICRAVLGVSAFWVSYLRAPLFRSLQERPGFWFYGLDSQTYFDHAVALATSGLTSQGSSYSDLHTPPLVVTLAVLIRIFGAVPSVGLFLNLVLYLICCSIIVWWGVRDGRFKRGATLALAFYCFSPTLMIWWTQPLKDTASHCALLIFIAGWVGLIRALWNRGGATGSQIGTVAFLLMAGTLLLTGLRPYMTFLAWVSAFCSLLVFLTLRRSIRVIAGLAAILVVLVSGISIPGVSSRMPGAVFLQPGEWGSLREAPSRLLHEVEGARRSAEINGGATDIRAGYLLEWIDRDVRMNQAESDLLLHKDLPRSVLTKFAAGFTALLVPRAVAMPGIIRIDGGRGFWMVAEIDTVWFDGLLGLALVTLFRNRREAVRSPVVWQVLMLTLLTSTTMAFIVSNFGSLLRQRGSLLVLLVTLLSYLPDGERRQLGADDHGSGGN